MLNALLLVLAISAVTAGPLDAGLDTDLGVDSFLQGGFAEDPDFATKTLSDVVSFAQARMFVTKTNDSATCNKTVEALEDEVKRHVQQEQTRVNNMDIGDKCIKEGDDYVAVAQTAKTAAELELKNAKQSLANAKTKKITWTYTYDAVVAESECGYLRSSGYLDIKEKVVKLTAKVAEATGKLETATAELESEKKRAAKDKLKCQCDTYTKMHEEIEKSKLNVKTENKKGWTKAKHLACVLAGTTDMTKCDTSGMPTVIAPKLAAGVDKSACATPAPTPPPTVQGDTDLLQDSCSGWRVESSSCSNSKFAYQMYTTNTWDKARTYKCPAGWHWAKAAEYFDYLKGQGCYDNNHAARTKGGHPVYNRCGHSGYNYGSSWYGYIFRFADSASNGYYQNDGSYVGYKTRTTGTSQFAGIVCAKGV